MADSYPTSLSQLHFPSSAVLGSVSHVLSDLRRSTLSIRNRLASIESDACFVRDVAARYSLPLVANERCGSWYITPEEKVGSAYFKSTDGHAGQWDFSLRRLNLQVLDVVGKRGGCIIVDSTRRGKAMPDALSKTVPIWCSVVNRVLFQDLPQCHDVHFPPDNLLGASEESQIRSKIDGFVASFKSLCLNLDDLRNTLGKPIRLAWATRDYIWPEYLENRDFHVIVLCSASKRVYGAEMSEGGYIQGAGDDSEGWAAGLTPTLFWENKATLLSTREEDLPELIEQLLKTNDSSNPQQIQSEQGALINPTNNLYLGKAETDSKFGLMIDCNANHGLPSSSPPRDANINPKHLNLGLPAGKIGGRNLRKVLSRVETFVTSHLDSNPSQPLAVICESGKDLSVGVALMIICLFYNDQGE